MRHRVAGVKLGRTPAHRRALLRNLVTALLEHEGVRTTDAKAKELRRWGDAARAPARRRAHPAAQRGEEALRRDRAALRRPRGRLHARRQAGRPPRGRGGALGGRAGRACGREDRESRPEEAAPSARPGQGQAAGPAAAPPRRRRVRSSPGSSQACRARSARALNGPPAECEEAERESARAARGGSRAEVVGATEQRRARSARAADGPPDECEGEAERESARAGRRGLGAAEERSARSARAPDGPPVSFDAPGACAYKERHARSPPPGPASRRLSLAPRGRG